MKDIKARLSKLEATRGSRPLYVHFTDVRGEAQRMSLYDLLTRLRQQLTWLRLEIHGKNHIMPPETELVPDGECSSLVKQLAGHLKYAGDRTQKNIITHSIYMLDFLYCGFMQTGQNEFYLLSGDTISVQGDKICVV